MLFSIASIVLLLVLSKMHVSKVSLNQLHHGENSNMKFEIFPLYVSDLESCVTANGDSADVVVHLSMAKF